MAKYSKKRHLREINHKYNTDPKYREEMDEIGCIFWGILIVVVLIIFFIIAMTKSPEEAVKWLK